jgi:hypothetical protein
VSTGAAQITNFDALKRLHSLALAKGAGSKAWIEFANVMIESFPALYETAMAMNAEAIAMRARLAVRDGSSDGSDVAFVEAERKRFEADAAPYEFDLTRQTCAAPEPWAEYADDATGHRWGGWLARAVQ